MNLQELIEKYPFIKQVLDFLDQYAGIIFACAFGLLIIYIFYWIIVIAPRRVKQVFAYLSNLGYAIVNHNSKQIIQLIKTLAPIYPSRPLKDQDVPEWKRQTAVKMRTVNNADRYIINVRRSQVDTLGVKRRSTFRKTNLILEMRTLKFSEPVHIYPVKNRNSILWKDRYKLKKISTGLDKEFSKNYHVYTKSGKVSKFPSPLRDALLNVCGSLCDTSRFCFQNGVTLKFQKEGWGICPNNEIYKVKDMKALIEITEKISLALS